MPDGTTTWLRDASSARWSCSVVGHGHGVSPGWVRKQLYLYQVMTGVSHGVEQGLQNTGETK